MLSKFKLAKKLVLPLMLIGSPAFAGQAFLLPEFGPAETRLDDSLQREDINPRDHGFSASFLGGYRFDNNFIIAGNFVTTINDEAFGLSDRLTLFELALYAGYAIPLSSTVSLVPGFGINRWELDLQEGRFLNPGEEERVEEQGSDTHWRVNLEIKPHNLLGYTFSYVKNEYDFGESESLRFGFLITF